MTSSSNHVPTSAPASNLDWLHSSQRNNLTPYQCYIRDFSWSETTLKSIESWPRELCQTVRLMMAELDPVILYWGENHTMIYNEAFAPLIGKQHPLAQGTSAAKTFPEFWPYFADFIDKQRATGKTFSEQASMLLMDRCGFVEETYFDWKLIPIIGEQGTLLGSYSRLVERTDFVVDSRRSHCLQNLTQQISIITSSDDLLSTTIDCLSQLDKDIPLAMIYSLNRKQPLQNVDQSSPTICQLQSVLGIPWDHPGAKKELNLELDSDGLSPCLLKAYNQRSPCCISLSDVNSDHLFDDLVWRGFGIPVTDLVILPIYNENVVSAFMVLGLNPRLTLSEAYSVFIKAVGDVISQQLARLSYDKESKSRDQVVRSYPSEMQKSDTRFSLFADRSPVGLSLADIDGKVIYANDVWYQSCGLRRQEYEPPNWIETVYEEDLPLIQEWWHKITKLNMNGTFQLRTKIPFIHGDKRLPYRTAMVTAYPDYDADGNVVAVMSLVTDVSELKWFEKQLYQRQIELEASDKKYRDFAEHAPIGVVRTDAQGYVQFANNAWRSFYNIDQDHQISEPEPWLASMHKEHVEGASQYFKEMCRTKVASVIEVRLNKRKSIVDANRTTSAEFWLLSSGFIESKPDGSVDNAIFWVTDISDQKAAERILTDKMEEAIRLKNTQERFVDMISHEIRNPLSAILHCSEEIVEAMKELLVDAYGAGTQNSISPGELATQDRMESRINSALEAANTILYCVQHQKQIVDDVLTLSKLDADLLVVSSVPVQPADLLKTALKIFEPELKASSIELDFEIGSSLEQLNVDWIMLDSNRFLQIVINLVTNAIKFTRNSQTKRILITVTARQTRPSQQHEGVHYVPRKQLATTDSDVDRAKSDIYLCFRVADSGKGLTEAERTILFNRFAQASPKTHIEYGGSGLGLFIARQITEMLGGEIGVGSEPGKGAVFAFYVRTQRVKPPRRPSVTIDVNSLYTHTSIPATSDTQATKHGGQHALSRKRSRPDSAPAIAKPASEKRRVLVVEDNLVNQKVLCKQLRNRGFLVEAANHGREALDALERAETAADDSRFDIVLCDIEMPVMDGIECVTEIRRLEDAGIFQGHVPIIGVTANVRSKQVNAAIDVGMDGVTTKPYRIEELVAHMNQVLAELQNPTD